MKLRPESHLARFSVRRPGVTIVLALLFGLASLAVILTQIRIDFDILNLLPQRFDSVRALKVYNSHFSQANEATFALWDEKGEADMEGFAEHFGAALREEPWVVRVMDRSPMEVEGGIDEVQQLAVPLLMNLPSQEFAKAMEHLQPEALAARLARKRAEIEAGSPKAEMELRFDPLGIVVPALKPLAGSFTGEPSRPLASEDGTLRLAIAVTTQQGLEPESCQAMMRTIEEFIERVRADWEGEAPQVLVTGPIAYVAEMSQGMEGDIISTVSGSAILVTLIFLIAFRRLRPLMAILTVLLLCCLGAVAAGVLIFRELNVVTMGVCAIMIGIGVDFGMIYYGAYRERRNRGCSHEVATQETVQLLGRGIFFGALTASGSFASLILSESPGFAQLGVLIGIGVMLAAVFMSSLFFAMIGGEHRAAKPDFLLIATERYLGLLFRNPLPVMLGGLAILIAANLFAYAPLGEVVVQSDPRSLEPAGSKAGFALRKITSEVPAAEVEPVLAFIQGENAQSFHDRWQRADQHWKKAQEEGAIARYTTPAPFAVEPQRVEANRLHLPSVDLAAAEVAFREALEREGFAAESFAGSLKLLNALQTIRAGDLSPVDWRKTLPASSAWIFVLDRFLSTDPNIGVGYIFPQKTLSSAAEQKALQTALLGEGVEARLTGWSYVMADLLPWSKGKLIMLCAVMLTFIITILAFLYRAITPLLVLLGSLALSIGMMIAGLKLTGLPLNLFNVLAFPLVLGIGVDYGIYTVLAVRQKGGPEILATVIKPIILSGVTTITAFGSLGLAVHPALSSLGLVCALGITSCLFATLVFVLPAYLWRGRR